MTESLLYLRDPDAVSTEPEPGKCILLQLQTGAYHALNASGTCLWNALEAPRTVDELIAALVERFGITDKRARQDVVAFLAACRERKLVESR